MSYLRKRRQKEHAAHARKGRLQQELAPTAIESQVDVVMSPRIDLTLDDETDSDGQCDWDGIWECQPRMLNFMFMHAVPRNTSLTDAFPSVLHDSSISRLLDTAYLLSYHIT